MLYDGIEDEFLDGSVVREGASATVSKSYRDLKIYRLAHEIGVSAHQLSLCLPKFELYETGGQLRRSAKSVSANIVEGYGRRRYKAEFLRFLTYAKAFLDETEEHLQYVSDCHPEQKEAATVLLETADHLGRCLCRFLDAIETGHRT